VRAVERTQEVAGIVVMRADGQVRYAVGFGGFDARSALRTALFATMINVAVARGVAHPVDSISASPSVRSGAVV
jgi:hypothetical protein